MDGHLENLIGILISSVKIAGVKNILKKGKLRMKEIKMRPMDKKRKQDLVYIVLVSLILFTLTILFLLINNIWVRYFMYLILAIYSSKKVTEWLTDDTE